VASYRGMKPWQLGEDATGVEVDQTFYDLHNEWDLRVLELREGSVTFRFAPVASDEPRQAELVFRGVEALSLREDPDGARETAFDTLHYFLPVNQTNSAIAFEVYYHDKVMQFRACEIAFALHENVSTVA
jgi:hypothetical protein